MVGPADACNLRLRLLSPLLSLYSPLAREKHIDHPDSGWLVGQSKLTAARRGVATTAPFPELFAFRFRLLPAISPPPALPPQENSFFSFVRFLMIVDEPAFLLLVFRLTAQKGKGEQM